MPELPEVETVVRTLRPKLVGRSIDGVFLNRADILCPADLDLSAHVTGRTVRAIERRGKRIIFTLDDASRFCVPLGMTGQLTVSEITQGSDPAPSHTHLELFFG